MVSAIQNFLNFDSLLNIKRNPSSCGIAAQELSFLIFKLERWDGGESI